MNKKKKPRSHSTSSERPSSLSSFSFFSSSTRLTATVLCILFAVGSLIRLAHASDVKRRSPDEIVYTQEAQRVNEKGIKSGFESLPFKVVYLAVVSRVMKLTGVTDERAGAWISCGASIGSLALVGAIAARFLSPLTAVYAMASISFSVFDRVIARRCWQDAPMEFMGLIVAWSACEITRDDRRPWIYIVLFISAAFTVLLKQVGVFLVLGVAAYVVCLLIARRNWPVLAGLLTGAILAGGATMFLLSQFAKAGRQSSVWETFYVSRAVNPDTWAMLYQSGPWYSMIHGLWVITPLNLVLSGVAVCMAFVSGNRLLHWKLISSIETSSIIRLLSVAAALVLGAISMLPTAQNFRYAATMYGPMYLLGGVGFHAFSAVAHRAHKWIAYPAVAGGVIVVLVSSVVANRMFERVCVRSDLQDLAIEYVLEMPQYDTD